MPPDLQGPAKNIPCRLIIQTVNTPKDTLEKPGKRKPRFLLLMPADLRDAIEFAAEASGRSLTSEINTRLRASLHGRTMARILGAETGRPNPPNSTDQTALSLSENHPPPYLGGDLHPTDTAILEIWRTLPAEKKLALLSLLR